LRWGVEHALHYLVSTAGRLFVAVGFVRWLPIHPKGSPKAPLKAKLPNICVEGEPHPSDIYEVLGHALSNWEMLQEVVAEMFYLLCDAQWRVPMKLSAFAVRRAYGTLTAPQAQRLAILAAQEFVGGFL